MATYVDGDSYDLTSNVTIYPEISGSNSFSGHTDAFQSPAWYDADGAWVVLYQPGYIEFNVASTGSTYFALGNSDASLSSDLSAMLWTNQGSTNKVYLNAGKYKLGVAGMTPGTTYSGTLTSLSNIVRNIESGEEFNLYDSGRESLISAQCLRGNNILRGNSLSNTLSCGSGSDQLWGGASSAIDSMSGGAGSDGYWWGKGEGRDTIVDAGEGGRDALFLYTLGRNEVSFQLENNNLLVSATDGSTLQINNWNTTSQNKRLQSFVAADNIVYAWNNGAGAEVNLYEDCLKIINPTKIISLDSGSCILRGGVNNDELTGNSGNDNLGGGTGGNDTMAGGAGSNAFWWGKGDQRDTVLSSSKSDMLCVYNAAFAERSGYISATGDLVYEFNNGADRVTVANWQNTAATSRLQSLVFSENGVYKAYAWNNGAALEVNLYDGAYSLLNVRQLECVDASNAILRGSSGDDLLTGASGNDQFWGGPGGADTLTGGLGSDTYWWTSSDGRDVIAADSTNNLDILHVYGSVTKDSLQVSLSGNDLVVTYDSANKVTMQNWNAGGGYKLNHFYFESDNRSYQLAMNTGAPVWTTIS